MTVLTSPGKSCRYLLSIPCQYLNYLLVFPRRYGYLLAIHGRYGWFHQPCSVPQLLIYIPSDSYMASIEDRADLPWTSQSLRYLHGIHERYGWIHQLWPQLLWTILIILTCHPLVIWLASWPWLVPQVYTRHPYKILLASPKTYVQSLGDMAGHQYCKSFVTARILWLIN